MANYIFIAKIVHTRNGNQ